MRTLKAQPVPLTDGKLCPAETYRHDAPMSAKRTIAPKGIVAKRDRRQLYSLHVAFTILLLQESAWILTPLLFCLNVAIQLSTFTTPVVPTAKTGSLDEAQKSLLVAVYSACFVWYLLLAVVAVYSLKRIHEALHQLNAGLVTLYIAHKVVRIVTSCIAALALGVLTGARHGHTVVYLLLESAVGAMALEIAWRIRGFLRAVHARAAAGQRPKEGQRRPLTTLDTIGLVDANEDRRHAPECRPDVKPVQSRDGRTGGATFAGVCA